MFSESVCVADYAEGIILCLSKRGFGRSVRGVSLISQSKHIFVGDTKTKYLYDYAKCSEEVNKIQTQNQIVFESQVQAHSSGYKEKENCV